MPRSASRLRCCSTARQAGTGQLVFTFVVHSASRLPISARF
ncbi:MAG: hypothetical protein WDN04_13755 [Rhodospirillales bacterium]